jgi:hypothetical protein
MLGRKERVEEELINEFFFLVGLAYQGKDIVFRFIIEYISLIGLIFV